MIELQAFSLKTRDFSNEPSAFYNKHRGYFYPYAASGSGFPDIGPEVMIFDDSGIYLNKQSLKLEKKVIEYLVDEKNTYVWLDSGIRDPYAVMDPIIMGAHGIILSSPYLRWPVLRAATETLENCAMGLFMRGELLLGNIGRDVYNVVEKGLKYDVSHFVFIVLEGSPEIRHAIKLILDLGATVTIGYANSDPQGKVNIPDGHDDQMQVIIPYKAR